MKINEIKEYLKNTINELIPLIAECDQLLSEKLVNIDENLNDTVDNETVEDVVYNNLCNVEHMLFYALGNMVSAKAELGENLELHELATKQQYEGEMIDVMEMYREYKNTEEILNGDSETKNE